MKTIIFLLLTVFPYVGYSQLDTTIWNDLQTISKDYYEVSAPSGWRESDMSAYNMEVYFEASGKAFAPFFNSGPFIVILALTKTNHNSLNEEKESIERGYSENKDRVFPDNFAYDSEPIKLISGEDAFIVHTRFYRKSKGLYQSRFDLAAYSRKNNVSYMYTISIQYNDETYQVEKDYNLWDFARRTYSYFKFK